MKKIISVLLLTSLILSAILCLTGCGEGGKSNKYKTLSKTVSYSYFNTVSQISSYGDTSKAEFEDYVKTVDETLGYYHKLFDIYYEYSGFDNIKTINKNAGQNPVKVDKELVDFLLYCKELYTLTRGKTNVMLGSVLKIWHDVRDEANENLGYLAQSDLPSAEALSEANGHTSIDSLVINEEECTVYISDAKASLDVGAVAKGYVVEILYNKLKAAGADSLVLNIGGNIRTIGLKPDGEEWVSGITDPDSSSDSTFKCKISLGEGSIVTSGDYERYFVVGDKKYHHIIDPDTLMPAAYFSAVSIITKDSALADALSTALFCMSYEEGLELIKSIGGVEVIWIDTDYNMITTDGVKIKS